MTAARDEAIDAMMARGEALDMDYIPAAKLLDAIPADVLARLAIEHGGLEPYVWPADVKPASTNIRLYRLVEP
jgi:hypothetical protein